MTGLVSGQPYPCWIFATRYQGVYEGGEWAAINCDPAALADTDAEGSDPECMTWWAETRANGGEFGHDLIGDPYLIAVGDTPQAALDALTALVTERIGA